MPTASKQENEEDVDVAALPPPLDDDGHQSKEEEVPEAEPPMAAAQAEAEGETVENQDGVDSSMKSLGATVAIANAAALGLGSAEEAAAVDAAEESGLTLTDEGSALDTDPKMALRIASQMKDKAKRDNALLRVLKDTRREMEVAKAADERATYRLNSAKEAYDLCAQLLAGYTPLATRLTAKKKGTATGSVRNGMDNKRMKVDVTGVDESGAAGAVGDTSLEQHPLVLEGIAEAGTTTETTTIQQLEDDGVAKPVTWSRVKGHVQPTDDSIVLPTNEIYLPEYFTSGGGMNDQIVSSYRDSFYLHLTKGAADSTNIDEWRPPPNNANLKSRAQLAEWIHIATHWNTGADGLDAGAFRAKHKSWYSRMKPVSYNLGRRTGIHLRRLDESLAGQGHDTEGMTVLCRYNKAGNKSVVYLDMSRLFDALFQIHALELNHRGRDATKNLADERYANIPDATVRAFLDTCPVCSARRGHGPLVGEMPVQAHPATAHYHQGV